MEYNGMVQASDMDAWFNTYIDKDGPKFTRNFFFTKLYEHDEAIISALLYSEDPLSIIKNEEYSFNDSYNDTIKTYISTIFNWIVSVKHNLTEKTLSIYIKTNNYDIITKIVNITSLWNIKIPEKKLNIIKQTKQGFDLIEQSFDTSNKYQNMVLEDLYNDDFIPVAQAIEEKLSGTHSGVVLLHGEMGTGKTSYMRYLISKLDKRVIYVPPDLTSSLSNPGFIEFLLTLPNSILIIEDAENVLQQRDAGSNNQAVANILNISDGLLGDVLKMQIICTFNCDMALIDKALMRPGRLIAQYKFGKLTAEKTNRLLLQLYGANGAIDEQTQEMTLAEIYNFKEKLFKTKETRQKIGFT